MSSCIFNFCAEVNFNVVFTQKEDNVATFHVMKSNNIQGPITIQLLKAAAGGNTSHKEDSKPEEKKGPWGTLVKWFGEHWPIANITKSFRNHPHNNVSKSEKPKLAGRRHTLPMFDEEPTEEPKDLPTTETSTQEK